MRPLTSALVALVAIIAFTSSVDAVLKKTTNPNFHGCLTSVAKALPYCDTSLSFQERVSDLVSRLTLEEKISQLSPDASLNTCPIVTAGVDRVGLPRYMWLVETNTGVASACISEDKCATTFPGPEGLGASFNRSLWRAKGDVISTELRALNNYGWHRGCCKPYEDYLIGLDGFGPNMNIARDPRFGRNSELPGEDPYLTGSYASNYVQGIQQVDTKGYTKMIAYLKHFDAYSVETNRGHDTHNISDYDFWDTYLPAYQMAFEQGNASGCMCSYNGENGHPSCANGWLLNEVIRKRWNSPDAVVTTDCGVLPNMMGPPAHAPTQEAASAWVLMNGTDIEAGSSYWNQYLAKAIAEGLATEAAVDASFSRITMQLMKAGRFDPVDEVSWTQIGIDQFASAAHKQVNYEAASQSFVLLKNDGILPLKAGSKIAVVGPQGVTQYGLLSDYYGDWVCWNNTFDCIQPIADAIQKNNVGGVTLAEQGVPVKTFNSTGIDAALKAVEASDVVVLALGIDKTVEEEGSDRQDIGLPGLQQPFAQQVLRLKKPTVLVLTNGGALAIDDLIDGPNAIVEAFNPSLAGAQALADTLFGHQNRWGKLPITMYPANFVQQQNLLDFDMTSYPGRTYRYYQGDPLFAFGTGLSLTTFTHSCTKMSGFDIACVVTNTGALDGDEVLMVFHSVGDDIRSKVSHPVPIKQLVEFERVSVLNGATSKASFSLPQSAFLLTNNKGDKVLYNGQHTITISRGHGPNAVLQYTITNGQNP